MFCVRLVTVVTDLGRMYPMLDVCSAFAARDGLQFSTDPDPAKSKSDAVFVVGRRTDLVKPAPLLLCGKALPYVAHAKHLGHELHEDGTMTMDANMRRGGLHRQVPGGSGCLQFCRASGGARSHQALLR
jgi:hypothetical protein